MRATAGLLIVIFLTTLHRGLAAAQTLGHLTVTVTDSANGDIMRLVRVVLAGRIAQIGFSDDRGTATFEAVPPGAYELRVYAPGFAERAVAVDVGGGIQHADITLSRDTATARIGSVRAKRADVPFDPRRSDALSAIDVLGSEDLGGTGFRGAVVGGALDVNGLDPSDAGFSIDGLPLGLGGPRAARGLDPNLFAGSDDRLGGPAGQLGGISLRPAEPTIDWQSRLLTAYGSDGSAATTASARGTAGTFGVVVTAVQRRLASPLDGSVFLDQTGATYLHQGYAFDQGLLYRLRARPGNHVVTLTAIDGDGSAGDLCDVRIALLPCGYGSAAVSKVHRRYVEVGDAFAVRDATVNAQLYADVGSSSDDRTRRVLAGMPAPAAVSDRQFTHGGSLRVAIPLGSRTTVAADFFRAGLSAAGTIVSPTSRRSYDSSDRFTSYGASADFRLSTRSRGSLSLRSETAGGHPQRRGTVDYRLDLRPGTAVDVHADLGAATLSTLAANIADDPASAFIDCRSRTAYINGGSLPAAPGRASTLRASLTRTGRRFAARIDGYTTSIRDGSVLTIVNGSQLIGSSTLPGGYLVDLNRDAVAECGSSFAPLGNSDLAIVESVPVATRRYDGIRVSGTLRVGTSSLTAAYAVTSARVETPDLPTAGASIVVPGVQLPGVPLHRWSIAADVPLSTATTFGVAVNALDGNNARRLPAFAYASAALRTSTKHGAVTISATNVTHTSEGRFATGGGVPFREADGALLPAIRRPFAPSRIALAYDVRVGRTPAISLDDDPDPSGGFGFAPLPISEGAPRTPFAANTGSPSCRPEALPPTRRRLDALNAYAAEIERSQSKTGTYPATWPSLVVDGVISATYRRIVESYALEIALPSDGHGGRRGFAAFMTCAAIHVGDDEALRERHAYVPTQQTGKGYLLYTPTVGIYLYTSTTAMARDSSSDALRAAAPLTVVPSAACSAAYRPIADVLARSVRTTLGSASELPPTRVPEGWQGIIRGGRGAWWMELLPTDPYALPAVLACIRVDDVSMTALRAAGIGGAASPYVNVSPQFALYRVAP